MWKALKKRTVIVAMCLVMACMGCMAETYTAYQIMGSRVTVTTGSTAQKSKLARRKVKKYKGKKKKKSVNKKKA